ncbi:hypothetical protein ACFV2X_33035 [Streptomyces sp. NPDC059679]|uniref:hypothetical protein n=1 Tax=Streptomyces sp. NPDC059679 TaxID=3346903 RepID=UPI0036AA6ECC
MKRTAERGSGSPAKGTEAVARTGDGDGRLPDELRALGRALESPPLGGSPVDGETLIERVMARIVGASAAAPATAPDRDGRVQVRADEQWRDLPGLTAGQGSADDQPGPRPEGSQPEGLSPDEVSPDEASPDEVSLDEVRPNDVRRSADRGRGRRPSARRPRP